MQLNSSDEAPLAPSLVGVQSWQPAVQIKDKIMVFKILFSERKVHFIMMK